MNMPIVRQQAASQEMCVHGTLYQVQEGPLFTGLPNTDCSCLFSLFLNLGRHVISLTNGTWWK